MPINIPEIVDQFFLQVASGGIEIYNEFSLQHEIGAFLRSNLPDCRIQFERPVTFFALQRASFCKKEIDIVISSRDSTSRIALEFKFPRNGQYPETMFQACRDIEFLEQLVRSGFDGGVFVMAAEDPLFYQGPETSGIYSFFRKGTPLSGTIQKPTGARDWSCSISGTYAFNWREAGSLRYSLVEVTRSSAGVSISPPLTMKRL